MKGIAPVGIDGELETAKIILGYIVKVDVCSKIYSLQGWQAKLFEVPIYQPPYLS